MNTVAQPDSDLNTSLGQWVARSPEVSDLLERYDLNFCCRGFVSLQEACWRRQLDAPLVLKQLRLHRSSYESPPSRINWLRAPLGQLCDQIEIAHHASVRRELSQIAGIVETVANAHASSHPELMQIRRLFDDLQDFFVCHLLKEEWVLFPEIRRLENGEPAVFQRVSHAVRVLQSEHDTIGSLFDAIRDLANDYHPPSDACQTCANMLDSLHRLEMETHRHVHKENHILFPRAVAGMTAGSEQPLGKGERS